MNKEDQPEAQPQSIRHAEKRRTASCAFADRVAQISIDLYRAQIPGEQRPPKTCLATIVVHDSSSGSLSVLGMGVGTKVRALVFL